MFINLSELSNHPFLFLLLPFAGAFLSSTLLLPFYINWLKKQQLGQFIRPEGPASHAGKAKTPTMGGVIIIFATILGYGFWSFLTHNLNVLALICLLTAGLCGAIGFFDDFAKFKNKDNRGMSALSRLVLEFILGGALACFLIYAQPQAQALLLRMVNYVSVSGQNAGHTILLPGLLFFVLAVFLIAATANSVNLNDGMDGLAAGMAIPTLLTLALLLLKTNHLSLASIALACAGALSGFLMYNCHPAKIFMGDVGSLFIGGLLGAIVLSSGLTIWFIPLALIYILETLSVLIQVSYFKLTKPFEPVKPMNGLSLAFYKLTHKLPGEGKRFFRMSPLHHHFEAVMTERGVSESAVVGGFWLVQLLICFMVLAVFLRI